MTVLCIYLFHMHFTSQLTVRPYDQVDKEPVLELLRLNTPAFFATEEEKQFLLYLENEIELYYVVELNGNIVGCGGINFADNKTAKISWDMLHPGHQGKSIGTALVKMRIEKLRSLPNIDTIVVRTSQHVFRFYEKQGFKLKYTIRDYWAPGFDLYFMELSI